MIQLNRVRWILSEQFGFDPARLIRSLLGLIPYIKDWQKFSKTFDGHMSLVPCLHDRYQESGAVNNEYFWQDLVVAQMINKANPERHVDIGSRVDGFVAHVASFRQLEVFDVRPISSSIPGVIFRQVDLMNQESLSGLGSGYCDSLSCLHALEHFGLGRYGDSVNPNGYRLGFNNMAKLLSAKGTLYLATPIGKERVEFNANWIFDPCTILRIAEENGLELVGLMIFNNKQGLKEVDPTESVFSELATQEYNLGIFTFHKIKKL